MTDRPILFSGPMVKAILEGDKTQTRRVVKAVPCNCGHWVPDEVGNSTPEGWLVAGHTGRWECESCGAGNFTACPYGQPGDRLWVRETFVLEGSNNYALEESRYPRDGRPIQSNNADDDSLGWCVPWYRATDGEPNIVSEDAVDSYDDRTRWKPSIFMPRWASRITLEVTEVRVQRLQEIAEEDAFNEGIDTEGEAYSSAEHMQLGGSPITPSGPARFAFASLWDSINGKRPGYDWTANPWVWAVTFKRIKP